MKKYDLKTLGAGRRRGRVVIPRIDARLSTERAFERAMAELLAGIAKHVREHVIPRYKSELKLDADTMLRNAIEYLTGVASRTVERILRLEAQRHSETFIKNVKAAIGIDLESVVRGEDLEAYMRLAVERNVSLITGIGQEMAKRIETTVYNNAVAGNSVESLRKALSRDFAFGKSRTQLIARDQTSKFNSDLTRIRQQQAGITEYEWSTSADERVRPLHRALDGKIYAWGERTGAEDGLPPGQPIRCRCVALGVVDFGKAELTATQKRAAERPPTLKQLEQDARNFVLDNGRRTGHEWIIAYDTVARKVLQRRTDGRVNNVNLTDDMWRLAEDPAQKLIVSHNHPASSSFSGADINAIARSPGIKGLWAEGHDGSSYYVERGRKKFEPSYFEAGRVHARMLLQRAINRNPDLIQAAGQLQAHYILLWLHKNGYVKYRAKLSARQKQMEKELNDALN